MVLPLIAALAAQSSRLSLGTTWSGEETLRFYDKAAEIDEIHRFSLTFRVTGSENGMFAVERRGNLLGSRVMDTDIPPPPYHEPVVSKEWVSPLGFLLDADPFEKGEFNLDRLIHFWLPSNLPDHWSADMSSTVEHFVPKGRADFNLTGKQGDAARQYSMTYTSPANPSELSATGTMLFDVTSGRLLTAKIEAKHAFIPGGSDRANVSITYTSTNKNEAPK